VTATHRQHLESIRNHLSVRPRSTRAHGAPSDNRLDSPRGIWLELASANQPERMLDAFGTVIPASNTSDSRRGGVRHPGVASALRGRSLPSALVYCFGL
jgi:hypothetical protein